MMKFDVLIPAYNEAATLPRVLEAIVSQRIPTGWQLGVIVADDGSEDETAFQASHHSSPTVPVTVLQLPHKGRSAARNRAVTESQADIVLLLGADIILRPEAIATHCLFHQRNPDPLHGAVGFVGWDPAIEPTPLMEWMVHGGQQNNFDAILAEPQADPRHFFYASNVSLKRDILRTHPFDETLRGYGWEDLELGRRLAGLGFTLYPLMSSIGLHHHYYSAAQIQRRQEEAGAALHAYAERWPAVRVDTGITRRTVKHGILKYSGVYALAWLVVAIMGTKVTTPRLFSTVCAWAFWHGYFGKLNTS